jgi:O-antigen ligase
MSVNFKALIVVLVIAATIFRLGKSVALTFSTEQDFLRRRNIWLVLTVTAFLSPNFWLFALVATPLLAWAGRKDSNPVALYLLLLHVIPPIPVSIPVIEIKELFSLNMYRLLSFCVLIPTAWRLRKKKDTEHVHGLEAMDFLLLAFGVLQLAIYVPPDLPNHSILLDSPTNVLRRAFLFFVDVYVLYFVVSRSCRRRSAMTEALAMFCLSSTIMAALAVFETMRAWLLYGELRRYWIESAAYGGLSDFYYFRGGLLRAQASAGHALSLGYLIAIALGFWLFLRSRVKSARSRIAVPLVLLLGLLATQARGPWMGAVVIFFAFSVLGPRALPRLTKSAFFVVLFVGVLSLTPIGEKFMNELPFTKNSTQNESVDYRQRLAERSWELIQQHPFFGDPLATFKMEDLRQGEGIIDIVNAYAGVALYYGLAGLSLFLGLILVSLFKAYRRMKEMVRLDLDFAMLGACLVACILGTLFTIGTASLLNGYEIMFYVLTGLAAAYAHRGRIPKQR